METKTIVISLGGSIIAPETIDTTFINQFCVLLKGYADTSTRFIVITGGGVTARTYITAAKEIGDTTPTDLDWIGIRATQINAELLRSVFGEYAHAAIILDPDQIPESAQPIIVGGGWKPGNSSDLAAVHAAAASGARTVVNLSNIDYVYTADPKEDSTAEPIHETSWSAFRTLLPKEWDPGLNVPFDPIAAEKAEQENLTVVIMNGNNIENLKNYLDGKEYIGTQIG